MRKFCIYFPILLHSSHSVFDKFSLVSRCSLGHLSESVSDNDYPPTTIASTKRNCDKALSV